ncbi:MAG: hypothetical protein ACOC6P_02140 [Candidatus Aminicenantaceae bacterium]
MRIKGISLKNLAIVISDYLSRNGVETVLSGGACVAIYTNNKFMSYDLDFVLTSSDKQKTTKELLTKIGFCPENQYFRHSDTKYFLDFVPPPLSVGQELVKEIKEIKKGNRKLKLLSPTDCVKDRLTEFYYWNDFQCLEQAVLVGSDNNIDLSEVARWSNKEGMDDKYKEFEMLLSERKT